MEMCILIRIHRINFKSDYFEIFPGNLHCFSDIFYIRFCSALSCKNQDFLQSCLCDSSHFLINLFCIQLCSADLIMAVKSAVNTVILTVICNINRGKHIHTVPKMFPSFFLRSLCDFLQKRQCSRRQQCLKILWCTVIMSKCPAYICLCIFIIIVSIHGRNNLIHHV